MNILFVCTGNTCRSPMAEVMMIELLKEKGIKDVWVSSAGTAASFPSGASYNSIMTMAKKNIDLTSHTSRMLTDGMLEAADAVYTMTRSQSMQIKRMFPQFSHKVRPLAANDITDPFGGDLYEYQACADEIYEGLLNILGGL
ncbi:MAG: low molecular weight protein arginine phosphatase [Clostridia bacterium]|nr:low molecular weight protein arginine phosphatase [Clostridia bacterium]